MLRACLVLSLDVEAADHGTPTGTLRTTRWRASCGRISTTRPSTSCSLTCRAIRTTPAIARLAALPDSGPSKPVRRSFRPTPRNASGSPATAPAIGLNCGGSKIMRRVGDCEGGGRGDWATGRKKKFPRPSVAPAPRTPPYPLTLSSSRLSVYDGFRPIGPQASGTTAAASENPGESRRARSPCRSSPIVPRELRQRPEAEGRAGCSKRERPAGDEPEARPGQHRPDSGLWPTKSATFKNGATERYEKPDTPIWGKRGELQSRQRPNAVGVRQSVRLRPFAERQDRDHSIRREGAVDSGLDERPRSGDALDQLENTASA